MECRESEAKHFEEFQPLPKKVLVHFEERIREVGFSSGSGKEGNVSSLFDAIVKVFADVLPTENPMHQLILQIRNEDRDGECLNAEFLDTEGEIPDKSLMRAVRMGGSSEGLGHDTRLQGEVRLSCTYCGTC